MNKLTRWFILRYMKNKAKGGDKMFQIILAVLAYLVKNIALITGVLEAVAKAITGIITLTPTKKDDVLLPKVDAFFSGIKKFLYQLSEFMTGKKEAK